MKQVYFTICILLLSYVLPAQSSIPSFPGWKMQEQDGRYSFRPTALEGGSKSFVYEVLPLMKKSSGSIEGRLMTIIGQDLQQSGYTAAPEDNKRVVQFQSGLYTYGVVVKDNSGKTWYLSYIAYRVPGDQFRMARFTSSPDQNVFASYGKMAATHFGKIAISEGIITSPGTSDRTASSGGSSTSSTTNKRVKPDELVTANGLKPAEVKGIAINMEYITGVGGGIYPSYEPYLLLTDGSIYDGPSVSPYHFDVAKSKQLEPAKWGTWKAVGKTMVISWPAKKDKSDTWEKNWFWARPATNGEKVVGSYKTISGGGNTALGGNVMIVSASNITFNKSGQFTMMSTSGGSNNGDFGVASTAYAHKDGAGTYVLNGYSLELRFNNGQVQQKSFYFYPDSKEAFGIGTSAYVPADKK